MAGTVFLVLSSAGWRGEAREEGALPLNLASGGHHTALFTGRHI